MSVFRSSDVLYLFIFKCDSCDITKHVTKSDLILSPTKTNGRYAEVVLGWHLVEVTPAGRNKDSPKLMCEICGSPRRYPY